MEPSYTFNEGAGTVTVELQKENSVMSEQDLVVTVEVHPTENFDAEEGTDFTFNTVTLIFLPSQQMRTVDVNIISDATPEATESFFLSLEFRNPLSIPQQATTEVFITDDDG